MRNLPSDASNPTLFPMPNVYAFQTDIAWEDPRANYDAVRALIDSAKVEADSLVVLPELFDVGFTMNAKLACAAADQTRTFLSDIARATRSTVIAGHAACEPDGRLANGASVVAPGGALLARYIKCHGFTPAGEHEAYAPGDGPVIVEWAGLKVAPLVCYDLRFPELFRAAVKQGAEMFVVIANWPATRVEHWTTLAKARAIENQSYVIALNRSGRDPKSIYPGKSILVDPQGAVLAEAGEGVEVLRAAIDPQLVRDWRRDFPALRDARFLR